MSKADLRLKTIPLNQGHSYLMGGVRSGQIFFKKVGPGLAHGPKNRARIHPGRAGWSSSDRRSPWVSLGPIIFILLDLASSDGIVESNRQLSMCNHHMKLGNTFLCNHPRYSCLDKLDHSPHNIRPDSFPSNCWPNKIQTTFPLGPSIKLF